MVQQLKSRSCEDVITITKALRDYAYKDSTRCDYTYGETKRQRYAYEGITRRDYTYGDTKRCGYTYEDTTKGKAKLQDVITLTKTLQN